MKRPVVLTVMIVVCLLTICFLFSSYARDTLMIDMTLRRNIFDTVFFTCAGIAIFCVDLGPQHEPRAKWYALLMFAVAAISLILAVTDISGLWFSSRPPAQLDPFGNPVIPEVNSLGDVGNYFESRS